MQGRMTTSGFYEKFTIRKHKKYNKCDISVDTHTVVCYNSFRVEKRWKEHSVNFSLSEIQYRFFMQMYDHPQQWGSLTDRRVGCRCGLGDHVIDWVRSSNFISWLLYNQCVSTSSCETVNKEWHIFATAKQAGGGGNRLKPAEIEAEILWKRYLKSHGQRRIRWK